MPDGERWQLSHRLFTDMRRAGPVSANVARRPYRIQRRGDTKLQNLVHMKMHQKLLQRAISRPKRLPGRPSPDVSSQETKS